MYNINWPQLRQDLTPPQLRNKIKLAALLDVCLYEISQLHQFFLVERQDLIYKSGFTGQIIYLEHRLNDRFDAINRGIYIDNVADINQDYIFNAQEQVASFYLYNSYDSGTTYQAGEYAQTSTGVYRALQTTVGHLPDSSPTYWVFAQLPQYLLNTAEYQVQFDFIVMVPVAITFDINEMRSIVNYYKLAGKRFNIQTY